MSGHVDVAGVWKAYPRWPPGGRTLRGVVARRVPLLVRRGERRWALRDVSLRSEPGQAVGVIGPNGAGKSTLLRLAAGLGRPTRGDVDIRGRPAAVLTLGDTLDPTLTGRENAVTAAVIAGARRAEARALVDRALAFAELEEVADAPVRTYSDGMRLRLAFGVVAQLEPDVLLVDEVIAVGDLAFQSRCLERLRESRERGAAVVLASHDLGLVRSECDRAVWLEDGLVRAAGGAEDVVDAYEEAAQRRARERTPPPPPGHHGPLRLGDDRVGTQAATIEAVEAAHAHAGDPVAVTLTLRAHRGGIVDPIVQVALHGRDEALRLEVSTRDDGVRVGALTGERRVTLRFERLDLAPGEYVLDVGLYSADWSEVLDYHWHAHRLHLAGPAGVKGLVTPPRRWLVGD